MDRESLDTHMLEETVTSAANGDRAARDLLLSRYWHIIEIATRARLKLVHGREDASDIAQDAAIRALLALRDYKWQGRKPFLVWLRTIADSAAADAGRRHTAGRRDARRELGVLDDETPAIARSAESLADVSRHADAVREQLERLDDDERTGIEMNVLGYSYAEIADHLGLTAEAARKRIERAQVRIAYALKSRDR